MSDKIFEAIDAHDANQLAKLLAAGADPNTALTTFPYCKPLATAIEEEYHGCPADVVLELVKLLVKHGADVNAWDDKQHLTPLLAAVYWHNRDVASLLLDAGSDPNAVNSENETALLLAVEDDDCEMVKIILEKGGKTLMNRCGGVVSLTPLGCAALNFNVPMIKLLISEGADINLRDSPDNSLPFDYLKRDKAPSAEAWDEALALLSVDANRSST